MDVGKKKHSLPRKIFVFLLAIAMAFAGWAGYVSLRYDLPLSDVVASCSRYVALTAIATGVQVYDPCVSGTVHPSMGPEDEVTSMAALPRIEDYIADKSGQGLQLMEVQNEHIVRSHYSFSYQPDVPRLRQMREEMGLDKVVADAQNELEKMIKLRQWVRRQFSRVDYQKRMERFDALAIWKNPQRNPEKRKKRDDEYNPCHFFPLFYSQVLMAMGYNPRMVGITYTGYGAHGFVEVWSNQYKKWISMDPDLNLHYELDGIPQNMLEVHNARYNPHVGMVILQEIVEPGVQPVETMANMITYHKYFKIGDMRNDWLTNAYFPGHPVRSDLATLYWKDPRLPEVWRISPETSDPDDMYWTLDQAEIHVDGTRSGGDVLGLVFRTITPNFSHFVVDANGERVETPSAFFKWQLRQGTNELSVYPVNSFGVAGIESRVVIGFNPS